jgi:hypothetical protein
MAKTLYRQAGVERKLPEALAVGRRDKNIDWNNGLGWRYWQRGNHRMRRGQSLFLET